MGARILSPSALLADVPPFHAPLEKSTQSPLFAMPPLLALMRRRRQRPHHQHQRKHKHQQHQQHQQHQRQQARGNADPVALRSPRCHWLLSHAAACIIAMATGASAQTSIGTVTCKATVDNTLSYFAVDAVSFFIPDAASTDCGRSWQSPCTFSFPDDSMQGQVVALEGSDDSAALPVGTYCKAAGLALSCASDYPASAWNDVKSDLTWTTSSAMTQVAGASWAAEAFDDSGWLAAVTSTSGFTCRSCGKNGNGQSFTKIWGCVCSFDARRVCMCVCVRVGGRAGRCVCG
jgi:hypothetical protein